MPLVNEVVIGLKDKDKFNASQPRAMRQFADLRHQSDPAGAARAPVRRGRRPGARQLFPRTDLVAAFLTGIDGLNQQANGRRAEMLRLNTATRADAGRARRTGSA